ncbi:MAG: SRPBCC domain-containing protein [Armatimonadetes bacterium]|nr:SRPBCC domain-containing protein [Armatimonadota bacterium]
MSNATISTIDPESLDLLMSRTFDAPRDLVWQAWTDPNMLMRWICPHGFSVMYAKIDLQVGGGWSTAMRHSDGDEYFMEGTYREIDPPRRLVMTHKWMGENRPETDPLKDGLITVDLVEIGGKTLMTFRHAGLPSVESREDHRGGWNGAFDHLNELVRTQTPEVADRSILLSRTVRAPKEVVFAAFTEPEQVGKWWGPNGFTTTIHEMDVRPGGVWRFMMHGPDGTDYPNRITYIEVDRPNRLVYDHTDDQEEPHIHFQATVEFQEDDKGETTVTLHTVFESPEALAEVMKFGAVEGGRQTLGRLSEFVDSLNS